MKKIVFVVVLRDEVAALSCKQVRVLDIECVNWHSPFVASY
jgi:hypothetical protein